MAGLIKEQMAMDGIEGVCREDNSNEWSVFVLSLGRPPNNKSTIKNIQDEQ